MTWIRPPATRSGPPGSAPARAWMRASSAEMATSSGPGVGAPSAGAGARCTATVWGEGAARRLHVVDLDAATGLGDNRTLVERLVAEAGLEVQVAGGVRSEEDAARWLESGAAAVVMGTTAVRQPETLAAVAGAHPGRVL